MMIRNVFFAYLLLSATSAFACDIKRPQFGASIAEMATKYDLDTLGASPYKRTELVERATQFCSELPSDAVAIFTFLYGQFVELKIERLDSKDTLLTFMKKYFETPKETENSPKDSIMFDPNSTVQTTVYRVQSYEEGKEKEIITLTSKSYANLFKQAAQDEKSNIVKD